MGFFSNNIFFSKDNEDKPKVDPNKPLKGQLDSEQEPANVQPIPTVSVSQDTEMYKKMHANISSVFNSLNHGPTSYHEFLNQLEFLKDVIPSKEALYAKSFQMLQKQGGDKFGLQQSAAEALQKIQSVQKEFNEFIAEKKQTVENQFITDTDNCKKEIIALEREINLKKQKLQELNSNIAVTRSNLDESKTAYNEISADFQVKINADIKEIQKLLN